jgi:Flp pilus assembly protein TadB
MNPKGISHAVFALILFSFVDFFLLALYCITFLFAVALNKALARVASSEAELKTTSQALKEANIAKNSVEKVAKTTETKAKKAEKALAEIAQKQSNREGAVVERLDAICTSVGSKCFVFSLCLAKVRSVDMLLLTYLYFCDATEKLGEVWKLRQESAKDPLLDAVEVLESNWRLA